VKNDQFFPKNEFTLIQSSPHADLIQALLYEIFRVKELIKYYEAIPDNEGMRGAAIMNELVAAAYESLVNYDLVLMNNYFNLLRDCD
jgi:hypothetical protein